MFPRCTSPPPAPTTSKRLISRGGTRNRRNILGTETATAAPNTDLAASAEAEAERVKDQIDDAVAKGPKKADENSGGRVQVAETGDLHDLAARRQSS